jgi:hypothetical protein
MRLGGLSGLFGKNERCLAGAQQLEALANFQFLLGRILLELLDAIAAVVVLALEGGVVFFQLANVIPLLTKGGQALRAAQRPVAVGGHEREDDQKDDAANGLVRLQRNESLHLFIILF